jgi:protein O-mannosyl-transferase
MAWSRRREVALLAGVVVVFALSLGRTAGYEFVWDDVRELAHNPAFDAPLWEGLGTTQTERTEPELTELSTIKLAYDSYRPVLFASYWIDLRLFGRSATALHVINVLLGALAIVLAYLLARRWIAPPLALIATAVFALHPVQIEAVAYISARGDLLAAVFALLATLAARRAIEAERRGVAWIALAALAFAASLLTKEAYLGLPVAIAVMAWSVDRLRARWWVPAILIAVVAGYLVLRAAIVTATTGGAATGALRVLPGSVLAYARILLLPFDLSTERLLDPAYTVPGWIAAALALGLVAWRGAKARPAVAGVAWMVVLIAPSAIAIASMRVVADRYAYLSTLGAAIALVAAGSAAVTRWPRFRVPLVALAVAWGALTQLVAWRQVPVWADNTTLYTHAAEMAPDSSSAQYRLGYLEAAAGRWPDAIARFERAVELEPRNVLALNNLGVGYLHTGDVAGARRVLAQAVEINPAHFRAWLNLGLAQLALGEQAAGCASVARALQINPGYEAARRVTSAGGRCSP